MDAGQHTPDVIALAQLGLDEIAYLRALDADVATLFPHSPLAPDPLVFVLVQATACRWTSDGSLPQALLEASERGLSLVTLH
jgi:hypothetical protein